MVRVIVERAFANPVTPEDVRAATQKADACFTAYRVRHLRSSVSLDGLRVICEYEAPDAETVRVATQRTGLPFERVWTATVIGDERSPSN